MWRRSYRSLTRVQTKTLCQNGRIWAIYLSGAAPIESVDWFKCITRRAGLFRIEMRSYGNPIRVQIRILQPTLPNLAVSSAQLFLCDLCASRE